MIRFLRGASAEPPERRDDVLVENANHEEHLSWNTILVWFMRTLSILWLIKGLAAWMVILGVTSGLAPFEGGATGYQAGLVYFAVIDLVAAVGLWLTSTWGGVLWLLAVMSHLILAVFFPRFVQNSTILIVLFIVGIMLYLTISWLASMEE